MEVARRNHSIVNAVISYDSNNADARFGSMNRVILA